MKMEYSALTTNSRGPNIQLTSRFKNFASINSNNTDKYSKEIKEKMYKK